MSNKELQRILDGLKPMKFDFYAIWYVVDIDTNVKRIKEVMRNAGIEENLVLCFYPYGYEENYNLIGTERWEEWRNSLQKAGIKGILVIK